MGDKKILRAAERIYTTYDPLEKIASEENVKKELLENIEKAIYLFLDNNLTIGKISREVDADYVVINKVFKDFLGKCIEAYKFYQQSLDEGKIISNGGAAEHVGLRRDLYESFFWYKKHLVDANDEEGKLCLKKLEEEYASREDFEKPYKI